MNDGSELNRAYLDVFDQPAKLINQHVKVYRNLHKDVYSVQAKVHGSWRVVLWTKELVLHEVTFKVNKKQWQRVRDGEPKTVHAFVCGVLAWFPGICNPDPHQTPSPVRYNPRSGPPAFTTSEGQWLWRAQVARLDDKGVKVAV